MAVGTRAVTVWRAGRLTHGVADLPASARVEAVRRLVALGLRTTAADVLLVVRTEDDPAVLDEMARIVRAGPPVRRPSANLRELLQWASSMDAAPGA
jgi:hypothetical protein